MVRGLSPQVTCEEAGPERPDRRFGVVTNDPFHVEATFRSRYKRDLFEILDLVLECKERACG